MVRQLSRSILAYKDGVVDPAFSLKHFELRMLVEETELAWQSLGSIRYVPTNNEVKSLVNRRSMNIGEDLKVGEVLTKNNVCVICPG